MLKLKTLFTALKWPSTTLFMGLSVLNANTYGASAANIQVNHCADCGQVLIGAARIDFKGIVWTSWDTVSSLNLSTVNQAFGLTGDSIYLSDTPPLGKNPWMFNSARGVSISNPQSGDNMNHFFAPFDVGEVATSHEYMTLLPTDSKTVEVKGVGVVDNPVSPAIKLDVTIQDDKTTTTTCGQTNTCQVPVALKGTTTFTVTPTVDLNEVNKLAIANPGLQEVKYVLVKLRVTENNTQCSRSYLSFKDSGVGSNSFKENDYYHYLESGGPSHTPDTCTRNYSFLVSAHKSFQFRATSNRDTGANGYVEYAFYINGHYDSNNPDLSKWPGSWKIVQLGNHFPPVTEELTTPPVTEEPTTPPVTEEPTTPPVTEEPTTPPVTTKPENNSVIQTQVDFSAIQRADSLMVELTPLISPSLVDGDILWLGIPKNMLDKKVAITFDGTDSHRLDLNWVVTGPNVVTDVENSIKGVGVQPISVGEPTKQIHHTVNLDSGYYYESRVKLPEGRKPGLWYLEVTGEIGTQFNTGAIPPAWLNFQIANNQPKPVSLEVPTGSNNLIVTLSSGGKEYAKYDPPSQLTKLPAGDYLPAGNYVMNLQNNTDSNEVFSMSLTYDRPINHLNFGGWIDSGKVPKVGFLVNSPQRVDFNLQFGESFQGGAEKPEFALCKLDMLTQTWTQVLPVSDKNEDCQ